MNKTRRNKARKRRRARKFWVKVKAQMLRNALRVLQRDAVMPRLILRCDSILADGSGPRWLRQEDSQ